MMPTHNPIFCPGFYT